jgi:2-dehydropantoate 2-reductase
MRVAVLGPGGVGGLVAGALDHAGSADAIVVARADTRAVISAQGLRVSSVSLGEFVARPKALERIAVEPPLVLPLLNGLDHIAVLRERFGKGSVLAGSIRVEADRPTPGVVVHTSPFLLVQMASLNPQAAAGMHELARALSDAGIPARVLDSEPQVMWSKLVRLNALACTTSAYDKLLGEIRSTPALRADLEGAIEEACSVGRAEGARDVDPATAIGELDRAHATLGSSMQRDIAAGRVPELDAIPGSVLRAAARHQLRCPTIERLVAMIAARARVPLPVVPRP